MVEVRVGESEHGSRITAVVGDTVILRLAENPTTGYRWSATCAANLIPSGDSFVQDAPAIGAGGSRILRFTAVAGGTAAIEATLLCPWQQDHSKNVTFKVFIEVAQGPERTSDKQ